MGVWRAGGDLLPRLLPGGRPARHYAAGPAPAQRRGAPVRPVRRRVALRGARRRWPGRQAVVDLEPDGAGGRDPDGGGGDAPADRLRLCRERPLAATRSTTYRTLPDTPGSVLPSLLLVLSTTAGTPNLPGACPVPCRTNRRSNAPPERPAVMLACSLPHRTYHNAYHNRQRKPAEASIRQRMLPGGKRTGADGCGRSPRVRIVGVRSSSLLRSTPMVLLRAMKSA